MDSNKIFCLIPAGFPLLTMMTLVPLTASVVCLYASSSTAVLRASYAAVLMNVLLGFYLLWVFDSARPGAQLVEQVRFAGVSYCVGVDGANILFIPLTALLALLTLVYSVIARPVLDRILMAGILTYEAILIGAFTALNLLQFWLWSLLELVSVLLLTLHAGSEQNKWSAIVPLLQYWGSGLLMTLTAFMLLAFGLIDSEHPLTFDWQTLKQNNAYLHDEVLIFILLFFGFAIRLPLFPFHGWLPELAEQRKVVSAVVFLVGLKLGLYAMIRFILPLVPGVAEHWAGFVITLSLIGIIYGGIQVLVQINLLRLLAFVAISHSGLLMIGLFSFNEHGLEGSLLLSITYGLATAGMLFSVGMIYWRTRTVFIPRLGGLLDNNSMLTVLFPVSVLTTMVIPGMPGFEVAKRLFEGVVQELGWWIAITLLSGHVLSMVGLLKAFRQVFVSALKRDRKANRNSEPSTALERLIALVIGALLIGCGFYSTLWLDLIEQEMIAIRQHYPMHGELQFDNPSLESWP